MKLPIEKISLIILLVSVLLLRFHVSLVIATSLAAIAFCLYFFVLEIPRVYKGLVSVFASTLGLLFIISRIMPEFTSGLIRLMFFFTLALISIYVLTVLLERNQRGDKADNHNE